MRPTQTRGAIRRQASDLMKTVAAISTSPGPGAVSVVRVSGDGAFALAARVFRGRRAVADMTDRRLYLGTIEHEGRILDRALVVKFTAPHSFTGEDMVEFHCHGGVFVPADVLSALLAAGAALAENGEFSKRAYLNGKLDLSGAEGIVDVINAESRGEANAGFALLAGGLRDKVNGAYDRLTDILAQIEAALDYPEENLIVLEPDRIRKELTAVRTEIAALAATYAAGKLIKRGVNVVLAGETNAGKSSLLNALVGAERAIVTEIAGTTTDCVEGAYVYNDIKVNVTDTAGIRETDNRIENIGVRRARDAIRGADIVLVVTELPAADIPKEIRALIRDKKQIRKLPS